MKRIGFLERMSLRIYTVPGANKKFLNMRKSFDQVNKMVQGFHGEKTKKK